MRLRSIIMVSVLLSVLMLSACGALRPDTTPAAEQLTIYSGRNENLVGPVIERFMEETGISVEVRYGNTAELAATILEEGANTPADIYWPQDPGGLGALEHRFATLPDEILDQVEPRFRSNQALWVGVSGRARVISYNTERVDPAELPSDIWELTEPAWQGRVGWAPTNASFQAMVTAMRVTWGEEETARWLTAMQANDPVMYPNNSSQLVAVDAGEVDVVLTNHYYLYGFLREQGDDFAVRNHHLAAGPETVILVAGVGILEDTAQQAAAERFVAFLVSPEIQQYFAEQTFEYPVVAGIDTHELLTPLDEIGALDLEMSAMADLAGTLDLLRRTDVLP
jgi:iron(III) transport system substrate-binding protein